MVRKSHWAGAGLAVLIGGCLVGGCAPDAFFAPSVDEAKQLHLETRVLVETHDDNMTGQHQAMNPEAADEIDLFKQSFEAEVVRINERAEEVHSKVGIIIFDLAEKFGLGGSFVSWVNDLIDEEVGGVREDVTVVEGRLAELQTRLATVSADGRIELEALKGDKDAFLAKLESLAELTSADMEALKGLSTEQIMAMLLAAAGAVAGGGALGKTGKSRGAAEIAKLTQTVEDVKTDIARHKPVPANPSA